MRIFWILFGTGVATEQSRDSVCVGRDHHGAVACQCCHGRNTRSIAKIVQR